MFEHVGPKNYRTFMRTAHRCLKENGIFLLHTIGGNESKRSIDPWIDKYIFPNGILPSMAHICRAIEGLFVLEDLHNLAPHYDRTLMAWNKNFQFTWRRLRTGTARHSSGCGNIIFSPAPVPSAPAASRSGRSCSPNTGPASPCVGSVDGADRKGQSFSLSF